MPVFPEAVDRLTALDIDYASLKSPGWYTCIPQLFGDFRNPLSLGLVRAFMEGNGRRKEEEEEKEGVEVGVVNWA